MVNVLHQQCPVFLDRREKSRLVNGPVPNIPFPIPLRDQPRLGFVFAGQADEFVAAE